MRTLNIIESKTEKVVASIDTEETSEERLQAIAMSLVEKKLGKIDFAYGYYRVDGVAPNIPYFRKGSSMRWVVFSLPHCTYQYDIIEKGKK